MQVTELSAEGLKREYKVVVQAAEIEDQVAHRLEELKGRVRMPGFRPGKVPLTLLRKQYGRSVMGEVLEQVVNQGSQKAIADHELRPALSGIRSPGRAAPEPDRRPVDHRFRRQGRGRGVRGRHGAGRAARTW